MGGTALETGAFGEVEEPKEVGVVDGEVDIYRDSPLRYLGYANECGEAFRPLVPVEVVFFTYFAAISYVLADTVDKGKKGAAVPGDDSALRATFGAVDTFLWQMLASVLFPSFIINRLVTLLFTLQVRCSPVMQMLTCSLRPPARALARSHARSTGCPDLHCARRPTCAPLHGAGGRRAAGAAHHRLAANRCGPPRDPAADRAP